MIIQEYSTSALAFDGDFVFSNNDLKVVKGTLLVRIQALKDFLRTQYKDYIFYPSLGANLEKFVGRGIDENLKVEFEQYLKNAIITSDLFLAKEYEVYSIINSDTIIYRIVILEAEEEIIQVEYNTSSGVKIE